MPQPTEILNFKVPKATRKKIEAQAFAESITVSEMLRRAVNRYLDDGESIRRNGLERALQTTTNPG